MKTVLFLVLVVLLVAVGLPMSISMGDCPMCTSPDTHLDLGICAAFLSVLLLTVLLADRRRQVVAGMIRRLLIGRSIYRPPRFA